MGQKYVVEDSSNVAEVSVFPSYFEVKCRPEVDTMKKFNKRGVIVAFSRKARARLMKKLTAVLVNFDWWQTFTFADDVMAGRDVPERFRFAADCLKRFKARVARRYPLLWDRGVWRLESEARKSGANHNQHCPHYHMMFDFSGYSRDDYFKIAVNLAAMWVETTGTADPRALAVAVNPASYQYLDNQTMAFRYISKYMSKPEETEPVQRGRYWGEFGKLPLPEPLVLKITKRDEVILRRLARKLVKSRKRKKDGKVNRKFLNHLKHNNASYFQFVNVKGLIKYLGWQYGEQVNKVWYESKFAA